MNELFYNKFYYRNKNGSDFQLKLYVIFAAGIDFVVK